MPDSIHQLKITLEGIDPPIWRRIAVRSACNLSVLHEFIQVTMPWESRHLWLWELDQPAGGDRPRTAAYLEYWPPEEGGDQHESEGDIGLMDALPEVGARIAYVYDMGDEWRHEIEVERIDPAAPGAPLYLCLAGERAAPPEDIGGPMRYADMLEASNNPKTKQDRELAKLLGDFDPEAFSAAETNGYGGLRLLSMVDPEGVKFLLQDFLQQVTD